jgi:hypothetical protein
MGSDVKIISEFNQEAPLREPSVAELLSSPDTADIADEDWLEPRSNEPAKFREIDFFD